MEKTIKFDVLDRSLDVFQTRFLEASAGTGKTFAIEHLFVRLLIDGNYPLNIEEILAVTFTKAATRELKMRIRGNIERALQDLEQGYSSLDYLKKHLEMGLAKAAIFRLRAAASSLDRLQIFTIHGFCHKMLSEHAFEGNTTIEPNDPESAEHKHAMKKLIADFFRTGLQKSAYSPVQVFHLLKAYGFDLEKMYKTAFELIEKGTLISHVPCFTTLLGMFNTQLSTLPSITSKKFLEDFEELRMNYKNMTNSFFPKQAAFLATLIEKKTCSPEEFDRLLQETPFFLEGMRQDNLKVKPKPVNCHYPQLFEQLNECLLPLVLKAKDPDQNLLRIVKSCQELWTENHLKTFPDELLKKMAQCLENPRFLAKVSQKYKAGIIDEFQDTDSVQWNIFKRLFLHRACAFYLVGDPKQSIYAFRNADVNTYLHAKTAVPKSASSYLDTNFRSSPSLVEALNELFLFSPKWLGKLDLLRICAGKTEDAFPIEDAKGRVHFFIAESESVRAKNFPTKQMEEDLFFPFIAEEIQKLMPHGTSAILVKGRHQASLIHSFLKKWGIPSTIKRTESLLESPAFTLLYDLFHAIENPRNLTAVRRVLASSLFGWTAEAIEHSTLADSALFYEWHQFYKERKLDALFGSIFSSCLLDSSWAQAFRQWAEELLSSKEDPLVFLEEMRCKIPSEEEFKVRQEAHEGKVQIMTTHVSKGLEFDFVFALGIACRHQRSDPYLKVNETLVCFDPNDAACQAVAQELETEKLRQFYVALTRAKKRVYVAFGIDSSKQLGNAPVELFASHLGCDLLAVLESLKQRCSLTYSLLNQKTFNLIKQAEEPPKNFLLPSLPLTFPYYHISSFSAMATKHPIIELDLPETDLPAGAETGHILHRILEKAVFSPNALLEIIKKEIAATTLNSYESKISALLSPIFDLPLGSCENQFTLRDIPKKDLFQEMEFLFPREDRLIKGFIDLVILYKNKFYFIDWKSNLLADYTPAALHQAMQAHDYFLQATLYKEALERYFGHFSYTFGGGFYIFLRGPAIYNWVF